MSDGGLSAQQRHKFRPRRSPKEPGRPADRWSPHLVAVRQVEDPLLLALIRVILVVVVVHVQRDFPLVRSINLRFACGAQRCDSAAPSARAEHPQNANPLWSRCVRVPRRPSSHSPPSASSAAACPRRPCRGGRPLLVLAPWAPSCFASAPSLPQRLSTHFPGLAAANFQCQPLPVPSIDSHFYQEDPSLRQRLPPTPAMAQQLVGTVSWFNVAKGARLPVALASINCTSSHPALTGHA